MRGFPFCPIFMPREEPYNAERARTLRESQTPPEGVLWSRLRDRRLGGLKFRRQHPVGEFIVDFCCAEAMLVVEVDSSYHDGRRERDAKRDRALGERGYAVVRVTASEVSRDLDAVLRTILREVEKRLKEGEEG